MTERGWTQGADRSEVMRRLGVKHRSKRALVGMVHLLPLPGAPGWSGGMEGVVERAVDDAVALAKGGMDAVLVENFGDLPFHPSSVPPETVAAMSLCLGAVRKAVSVPVGVNVLRNDARSGLGLAAVSGARFIRVNVHTGTMFTDQGILHGRAYETLRVRRALQPHLLIVADVHVKHAVPLPGTSLEEAARETRERGMADVLVVTGPATGSPPAEDRIRRLRDAVPEAPVFVGSGVTPDSVAEVLELADGAIVGTALQRDGVAGGGIDPDRVRALVKAARAG